MTFKLAISNKNIKYIGFIFQKLWPMATPKLELWCQIGAVFLAFTLGLKCLSVWPCIKIIQWPKTINQIQFSNLSYAHCSKPFGLLLGAWDQYFNLKKETMKLYPFICVVIPKMYLKLKKNCNACNPKKELACVNE